ncbi:PREDICTED: protein BREAST CANCER SUSCEPTIBILITY 1 homolog [Camelina sativa]|uniref:Protein BREAST CANCER SUSCEPTIBILITY 1 homolog n=1 Tax=Camelina sativa TaxID=90675 RepID=A0ABM0UDE4_CAMSA|nr:PREDICTED: protein BREAST CANCER SUSCEPTIBILITY 1 homolog [Camelina sativa]
MADTSHLEKMGRELKCPICLSLFNSAVSLSCNHVFCNACIVKSMKLDATCPVCKIPYHRREIRGAPHMDSLVSIYKNMEDASGVNLFVSQNNNQSPSDKEKHARDDSIEKAKDKNRQVSSRKGRASKRKEYGKTKETELDAPGPIVMKPSSQTKKRVQLLQNLSSESLTKPTESTEIAGNNKDYTDKTVIRLDEHPCLNKEGDLPPFFWLRDEVDGESSSQRTQSDQLLDTTPVNVPSFSDLMDSDHESPPKADEQDKPNPGDMFDSEMFEWTQRPCSPEILPSPVKAKVPSKGEVDLTQKKLSKVALSKCKTLKAGSGRNTVARRSVGVSLVDNMESSAVAIISEKQDSRGTSGTITRNDGSPDENVNAKRATRSKGQSSRVQSDLNVSKEAAGKQGTKRKRSSIKSSPAHPIEGSNELSLETEIVGKGDQDRAHSSYDTHPEKQSPTEKPTVKKRGRKSNASSILKDLSGKTQKKTSEKRLKLDSHLISSKATQSDGNGILTDELNQVGDKQVSTNKTKCTVDKDNHSMQVLEKCSGMNKSSSGGSAQLQRCDGPSTKKFACAFCHSSEDTEASGEMAHYHRGEPVSADFTGGSKVIHVHKNCAEWAPNVYFNNFTAVNLDVELTRSRRISCTCCRLKGAALGCYNKSCKNSFHVTCAKLIPECRWDNENFVMLCPLDASIKLPCEETNSKERKCKRAPKGPLHSEPNQVSKQTDIGELQSKHFRGSSKKLVLSCSGLTVEEKTVITEFAELSGLTISKKWEPTVTHVIASINENGACKRTLKFMMAILEGKWILTVDWIKACMLKKKIVSEEPYEITMDVHGIREGPYLGRQRALKKKPKLFNGLQFYIMGDFEVAYKGYLQDVIVAAGGTILRRRPVSNIKDEASTIIVFGVEPSKKKTLTQRRSDAEALAKSARARAASSSWVLDSIAGCQILDLI